jgi:hypothetical protein
MKIKTKSYGLFYKDNGSWRGPLLTNINKDERKALKKEFSRKLKKKVKVLKAVWVS